VFSLTLAIGIDGVKVGVMVGVSVGGGVSTGVSVAVGGIVVSASAVALAAASDWAVAVPGDWEGRLQADMLKTMMQPTTKIFLVMFMVHSRIR